MGIKKKIKRVDFSDFADPKAYTATLQKGLYLVSQCLFNPYTNQQFYLVKVGKASHMSERMSQYNTYNPLMFHVDYHYVRADMNDRSLRNLEEFCQHQIHHISIHNAEIRAKEWVEVDRATYLDICEKGFSWFGL